MRQYYSADAGRALVQTQISSGLSGKEYCRRNKISNNILKYWRKKLGYTDIQDEKETKDSSWAKLEIPETANGKSAVNTISIKISGMTVEVPAGSSSKDIEQVLEAVAKICWK